MPKVKVESIKSKDSILLVEDHWSCWDKTRVSYLFPRSIAPTPASSPARPDWPWCQPSTPVLLAPSLRSFSQSIRHGILPTLLLADLLLLKPMFSTRIGGGSRETGKREEAGAVIILSGQSHSLSKPVTSCHLSLYKTTEFALKLLSILPFSLKLLLHCSYSYSSSCSSEVIS